jgi:DNA-binding MarR family transcriptional regulator
MAGMPTTDPPAAPAAYQAAGLPLADTIARLRRAMRRAARAADPSNPLAVAQLELLSAVAEDPGVRPGQLARRLNLARNSVTTLVNGLHTKGLISRTPSDTDARAIHLTLTTDGHHAVRSWQATNTSIVRTALAALTRHHQNALTDALPALRELTGAVDAIADITPTSAPSPRRHHH